jgi:MoxR-like ATPase
MDRIKLLEIDDLNEPVGLPKQGASPRESHLFEQSSIDAINAALGARRPLLVRGEPGVGKSQLARAAAQCLKRALITFVVDSRTESRDLLWHYDAVERLADAQICGQIFKYFRQAKLQLSEEKYLRPGPLWWAFNWKDAEARSANARVSHVLPDDCNWKSDEGTVLLIDEIDKGESDVPNGLLEALGSREITVPFGKPVVITNTPPLVIITTNAERMLPDAFLRRCLVLTLSLPTDERALTEKLVERGKAHFKGVDETVLRDAAGQLVIDRKKAGLAQVTPLPGQAEYLDLIRAVSEIEPDSIERQKAVLKKIKDFVFKKHVGMQ